MPPRRHWPTPALTQSRRVEGEGSGTHWRLDSGSATLMKRAAPDLLVLLALSCGLVVVLLFVAALPPTALTATVERLPSTVRLYYFYDVERNASGSYRWSRPQAEILVPVNRPGAYRVTLALQDSPALGPPRVVTLRLNGGSEHRFQLDSTLRDYTIAGVVDRSTLSQVLDIQLETSTAFAPGDARPLGVIIGRLAVTPVASPSPWDSTLLALYLPLLLAVYSGVRLVGAPVGRAAAIVGVLLGLGALLASIDRPLAFYLVYLPVARPITLLGLALLAAPLPLVCWAWEERGTIAPPAQPVSPRTNQGRPAVIAARVAARSSDPAVRFWSSLSLPLVPIGLLALGLRLYGLNRLSLWLDEGFTVLYARLPWARLFGLYGQYDVHPPLYYAVVKLAALVVPEVSAGRVVSALAGAATVLVLYALVTRIAGRSIALAAAAVLALSPLHIWYSQEARMYALAVLFVAFAYLALVIFNERGSPWCAASYGVAVLLALYTDFSAAYALAPQVFLLVLLTRHHRWRALTVWGAGVGAVILFLPWLNAALSSVGSTANRQAWFLRVSLRKIADSLLAIGGLSGYSSDYWSPALTPWIRWPALRGIILPVVGLTVLLGALALIRRRSSAAVVTTALLAGTVGAATVISVVHPGYADRTVLYATLGWALLIGAAPFAAARLAPRLTGAVGTLSVLVLAALALGIVGEAQKQEYRALANEAARVAASASPVLTDSRLTATFLDVYEPTLASTRVLAVNDPGSAAQLAPLDEFWFAYADYSMSEGENLRQQLAALGYERRIHLGFNKPYYQSILFLDLFVRPRASRVMPGLPGRSCEEGSNIGKASAPALGQNRYWGRHSQFSRQPIYGYTAIRRRVLYAPHPGNVDNDGYGLSDLSTAVFPLCCRPLCAWWRGTRG